MASSTCGCRRAADGELSTDPATTVKNKLFGPFAKTMVPVFCLLECRINSDTLAIELGRLKIYRGNLRDCVDEKPEAFGDRT